MILIYQEVIEIDFTEISQRSNIDFNGIDSSFYLLGLLSAFDNRYQAKADGFFEEISWKQFFAIICINLCKKSPTINELASIMGSSHQNVKQILLKLERKGFLTILTDHEDKRKQRIELSEKTRIFSKEHHTGSNLAVTEIFQGISQEQLQITIQTIKQMEHNLKNMK